MEMASQLVQNHKGYLLPALETNPTMEELLMINHQKWDFSQVNNSMEQGFQCAEPGLFVSNCSPCVFDSPVPEIPSDPSYYLPAYPQNVDAALQQTQYTALSPTAEAKRSLFQWQIQVEARKVGEVSPEMLSVQDGDGDTCLHIAVAQGRRALAYVFAAKMAAYGDLDVRENNGQTALQIATVTNQHLIVQDLVTLGAQINTCDSWGRSPLHVCAEKGHHITLQVSELRNTCSFIRCLTGIKQSLSENLLQVNSENWIPSTILKTATECGQPVDIDIFSFEGFTPLHTAVLSHNKVVKELWSLKNWASHVAEGLLQRKHVFVECIKTLLLMGASVTAKDFKSGRTCLHMASEGANVELLRIILDQQLSTVIVNDKTFSGNTALHLVCSLQNSKSQVEAVKLLMRNGSDPGIRNIENDRPCQLVPEGPVGVKVRHILRGKMQQ